MHRDTKIGLALGILLIGTVGAFCFRNRPLQTQNTLALSNPHAINSALEARAVKPYLLYEESTDPAHDESELSDHFNERAYPTRKEIVYQGERLPPNPIIVEEKVPKPIELTEVKTDKSLPKLTTTVRKVPMSDSVHIITSGDTLSGLAKQYLGSVARSQELFEANRDILSSPDRLQLGMKIRIPVNIENDDQPAKIARHNDE